MDYPEDNVMMALSALCDAEKVEVNEDGTVKMSVPSAGKSTNVLVGIEIIRILEDRQWVEKTSGSLAPSSAGRYWLARWRKEVSRRVRKTSPAELFRLSCIANTAHAHWMRSSAKKKSSPPSGE